MDYKVFSTELAGRPLTIEFGKYAQQANGSAFVRFGDTVVMVNATMSETAREGVDFFPLSVDFEEKQYSVGKIPGGFIKREGRPTEKATLTCRLIDRPLRPLFPKGMRNDVQVVATVLSVDTNQPPEIPAMIGSSVALSISDIPFAGPTGAVNVGLVDGEYVINPNDEQREKSDLHLTVAGTKDAVMMVEAGANEISEETMLKAILFAHEQIKPIVALQEQIAAEIGKEKSEVFMQVTGEDVDAAVREYAFERSKWIFETFDRHERQAREEQVKKETLEHFAEQFEGREQEICDSLYYINKEIMRTRILEEGVRPDGRALTEVRPIWSEVGVLPRPHGSAVFTRGETQVMTIATLGAMGEVQILDGITNEETKRYMHHYNMPPYSTGEAGRMKSPGRREIGHGALAERALLPMIPSEEEFPYAIRLVSEVLSSNGSTSQASVCGSTMALMDAGVPIKAPVAGVAMGLIKDAHSDKVCVLTDIQGLEDFLGDMDFKVCGTSKGITALQMDNKAKGLSVDILARALKQAHEGRAFILSAMLEKLPEPRAELRDTAPRIETIHIPVDKIRDVIGSGGKVVRGIQEETGANIDIQEDGTIHIAAVEGKAGEAAKAMILGIVKEPEVGEIYEGEVVGIKDFGAFVKLTPGKDGLLHISRVANGRVGKVEDVLSLGDIVKVQVLEVDPKTGKISLDRLDKPDAPEGSAENGREHSHRNNNDRGERDMRPGRSQRSSNGRTPRRRHEA